MISDLVPAGEPQCGATPPGKFWPVCARPPGNHAGRHGRHESADYMWNDRGWIELKNPPSVDYCPCHCANCSGCTGI